MMKRLLAASALVPMLAAGFLATQAVAQDTQPEARKVIYLFNQDYPPAGMVQHPTHPVQLTKFWQLLDKEMRGTKNLALTESVEDADYRVDIKCAGISHCSKLKVYLQSPQRDVLSSFTLHKVKNLFFSPSSVQMDDVAKRLAERLQESIDALEAGGYGYY